MGKRSIVISAAISLVVVALLILIPVTKNNFLFGTKAEFSGTRTRNPETDEFEIDFEILNTHDQESFNLEEGDELKLSWDLQKGTLTLYIMDEEQNPVYRADNHKAKETRDFSIIVPKGGEYTVHFIGYNAVGSIKIEHNK